jgi:hypothetical protein
MLSVSQFDPSQTYAQHSTGFKKATITEQRVGDPSFDKNQRSQKDSTGGETAAVGGTSAQKSIGAFVRMSDAFDTNKGRHSESRAQRARPNP